MKRFARLLPLLALPALATLTALTGCGKSSASTSEPAATKHDTPPAAHAPDPPRAEPKKADAPAAKVTTSPKPPFETVTFTQTEKKTKSGWPVFDATNVGTKTVKYMTIWAYAYDKSGKLVMRSSPPLSWNGTISPGGKSDFPIEIGGFSNDKPVPPEATDFELCYNSINFEGEDAKAMTRDQARCSPTKAKGKT